MKLPLEKVPIWRKSYSEQLDYLFNLRRSHKKRDLNAIRKILRSLGNPHRRYFRVLIAGTNGKGSTAAFMERMLREAGYRTGLFTSPHLVDFHERFRISGRKAPPRELSIYLAELFKLWEEELGKTPVFFDFITVLAALYFAEKGVEIAIFEAGIGGEKDATNALDPQLSVITQVGLDHCQWLGEDLESIASEKGGIFRPSRGAVIGVTEPAALAGLNRRIREKKPDPVLFIGRDFPNLETLLEKKSSQTKFSMGTSLQDSDYFRIFAEMVGKGWRPSLKGGFQLHNLSVALGAMELLKSEGFYCDPSAALRAAEDTAWPGRLQTLKFRGESLLVDGAHNPSAARALAESLESNRNIAIFGAMADKDWAEMLRALSNKISALIPTPIAGHPRSLKPRELSRSVREILPPHVKVLPAESLSDALSRALALKRELKCDQILVFGSLYLVGELMGMNDEWRMMNGEFWKGWIRKENDEWRMMNGEFRKGRIRMVNGRELAKGAATLLVEFELSM